jgi:zinc transport system substrate-binding protein
MKAPKRSVCLIAVLIVLALVTSGCSKSYALPKAQRMTVVATAYPLYEAAAEVGGARTFATNLLPVDPFGPLTDTQANELRTAKLAIVLGKGTQPNVDKVIAQRTGPTLSILDSFPTQTLPTGGVDPYVWENPQNMNKIVELIRNQYNDMDAAGSTLYNKYAKNLGSGLANLDRTYAKTIATCKTRQVVTTDPVFQYLTDRYGLVQVAVDLTAPQAPGSDPLGAAIDQYHPSTVYEATIPSLAEAKHILSKYGVRVSVLDPVITQTDQARRGGSNYISVMNVNLDALRAGLGCATKLSTSN